jgi:hypothetical protein
MGYGSKENVNINDAPVIYTLEPGEYHGGFITEAKKDEITDDKKPVVVIMFETADGQKHQHTEWDAEGDEKKATNQLSRVGSYIKQMDPEYVQPDFNSFEEFRTHVVDKINELAKKKVPVDFKIIANMYTPNKPKLQLPNYRGAVVASSKKAAPKMSASEISDLAAYNKYKSAPAGAASLPEGMLADEELLDSGMGDNPEDIL